MIVRKWVKVKQPRVVTMTVTVASVAGRRPLVGLSSEVEEKFEQLMRKVRMKERARLKDGERDLRKVASADSVLKAERNKKKMEEKVMPPVQNEVIAVSVIGEVEKRGEKEKEKEQEQVKPKSVVGRAIPLVKSSTASDVGKVMLRFRELEQKEIEGKKEDVYSASYAPKKYLKGCEGYGTPKPGTLTEARAKKASKHIAREMLQICEVIEEYGYRSRRDGKTKITFGTLFKVYQFISDKVVGILLRARKHNMVSFEGEMLFQRRDEDVVITLNLSHEEVQFALKELTGRQ